MGISFPCLGDALDESRECLFMRSIIFNDNEVNTLKHSSSGKMIIEFEGSMTLKGRELETTFSIKSPAAEKGSFIRRESFKRLRLDNKNEMLSKSIETGLENPNHEAAVKLQKVYKSFRTRRQLADCAVLVEQRWWKLLDFALLKRSSVSFFDIEKPESVVSRWSRAGTRAAKVGKGLSKDKKAQKLALQHWLEAIDPRHRYGHNLHFYYARWLHCEKKQPFFYWLDVGEGKEVNLERCPRTKLQEQCIKYLGPKERESYEVTVEDGKFFYKQTHCILDTTEGPKHSKWIFVLSTSKNLYVGQKKKGKFQHSSFLAGGAASAAGRLVVENGILKAVWPHSGHYRPTEENFQEFVSFLKENNVDLTDVKKDPIEEDEESESRFDRSDSFRSCSSTQDLMTVMNAVTENSDSGPGERSSILSTKIDDSRETSNQVGVSNLIKEFEGESEEEDDDKITRGINSTCSSSSAESKLEGGSSMSESTSLRKRNLFEDQEAVVPQALILDRVNSSKGMKSFQLGRILSRRWTTGAGPRIQCVRDYPSELQFRALEEVNLSPKGAGNFSPKPLVTSPKKENSCRN